MDSLVMRLSEGSHPIEANRPEKSAKALKERIELGYVHIMFKETGTELGIKLDKSRCRLSGVDFDEGNGKVHLEGGITLNYVKVKCVADIDVGELEGSGHLVPVDDDEYKQIMNK